MAAAKKSKSNGFVVVAPLIQATVGSRVLHFYAGDVLPSDVSDDAIENLKSLGYIAASESAPADETSEN